MVNPLPQKPMAQALLSFVLGIVYIGSGVVEFISSVGIFQTLFVNYSLMDALILLVIGAVFFTGFIQLRGEEPEPDAFLVVGLLLATVTFLLRLVIIMSNFLGWIISLNDWAGWSLWSDLTWSFWLYLFSLLVIFVSWFFTTLLSRGEVQ